jgi:hypothetical protein
MQHKWKKKRNAYRILVGIKMILEIQDWVIWTGLI